MEDLNSKYHLRLLDNKADMLNNAKGMIQALQPILTSLSLEQLNRSVLQIRDNVCIGMIPKGFIVESHDDVKTLLEQLTNKIDSELNAMAISRTEFMATLDAKETS